MKLWPRLLLLLLLIQPGWAGAASDYLPGQKWQTLQDGQFYYYFSANGQSAVESLLPIGRRAWPVLAEWAGYTPQQAVHVVVITDNDYANGLATPLPRNIVRLYVAQPRHPSLLQEYGDWLTLLFVHELAHIFHIDAHAMPATILRKIFGRQSVFLWERSGKAGLPYFFGFPNAMLPDTLIEGYAVWAESVLAGGLGRGNSPLSLSLRRNAARSRDLDRLGQAVGFKRDFPGGNAPRLYGGAFHAYVHDHLNYSWADMYGLHSRGVFPFFWGIPVRLSFEGHTPVELWDAWLRHEWLFAAKFDASQVAMNAGQPMAGPFLSARGPRFADDGSLLLSVTDGRNHDRILKIYAGAQETLVQREGGNGLALAPDGALLFEQNRRERDTAVVSALYRWRGGRRARQWGGLHRFEPHARGERVVSVRRDHSRYCLDVEKYPQGQLQASYCGPVGVSLHDPQLSPDAQQVAFVEWQPGSRHDLRLWDLNTNQISDLVVGPGDETVPAWLEDGRLFFVSTYSGQPELYQVDVDTFAVYQHTRTPTGVWQFALTGNDFVYLAPQGNGWYVFQGQLQQAPLPLSQVTPVPDPRVVGATTNVTLPPQPVSAATPYRAYRTLWPTGWTPAFSLGAGQSGAAGFLLDGSDVLARWDWATRTLLHWNKSREWRGKPEIDYYLAYNQGQWYSNVAGQFDPGSPHFSERQELGTARIFRAVDYVHAIRLHAAEEHKIRLSKSIYELGVAIIHDSRQAYAWSLIPGDGVFVKLLLAGDQGVQDYPLDGRVEAVVQGGSFLYKRVQWQVAAAAGADLKAGPRSTFFLHEPAAYSDTARHITGRGVPSTDTTLAQNERCYVDAICRVDRYGLWEAEIIWPLWWMQAGPGALPLYFDQLHLRTFVAGAHFRRQPPSGQRFDQQIFGGAELQLATIFAWAVPLGPIHVGLRWPLLSKHKAAPEWYLTTGLSFDRFGQFLQRTQQPAGEF